MKNIKTAVFGVLAVLTVTMFIAGCNKKDETTVTKKETTTETNNQTTVIPDEKKPVETSTTNETTKGNDNALNTSAGSKGMEMVKLPSMQCDICKKNIEKAVGKVEGVSVVKVDKNKKIAHVEFDKSKTDLSKIEDAITAAGYDANNKKKDMKAYDNLDECCKVPDTKK